MDWSNYQRAIFHDVAHGEGHSVVQARAGCGKTTTILGAFDHVPARERVLMVAFNKGIEQQLARRAPLNVQVKTLHAFGFAAVRAAYRHVQLDDRKVDKILREWCRDGSLRAEAARAVRLCKGALVDRPEGVERIVDEYSVDTGSRRRDFVALVRFVLEECARAVEAIDYDDMIWLPHRLGLPIPRFDRIFIDETQDLTKAQIDLALKASGGNGRVCAVGDDRQAIYGFRGADSRAMPRIIESLRAHVLPLSTTYRCPKAIVRLANEHVPEFYAASSAPEGEIVEADIGDLGDADAGDFVISRTNAPLIPLCMEFLRRGAPARILGRDIGAMLKGRVRKANARTVGELCTTISEWAAEEARELLARDPAADVSKIIDVAACIRALSEGASTVEEVVGRIDGLFSDKLEDEDVITLATTHKAKGLERERVWVLRDTYLKKETREEENLWYVAITRAKRSLVVVRGEKVAA